MIKLKKIFFWACIACSILYASIPVAIAAVGDQVCTCTERESYRTDSYRQCAADCMEALSASMPAGVFFENEPLCPIRPDGKCDCSCRFNYTMREGDVCSFAPPGLTGTYDCVVEIEGITVETGDPCTSHIDCVSNPPGRGECSTENSCYCDLMSGSSTFQTCRFKLEGGDICMENYQCISGFCRAASPEETKTCWRTGLPLPPGVEVEAPPKTEEEVFPTHDLKSPIGEVTGPELIGRIIKTVLGVVGALALAMFVYGGFTWLTSGGSPDKIKKGKDILMWAVIGLIIIFTSYTLVDFVLTAFGL